MIGKRQCYWCGKDRPEYSFYRVKNKNYEFCQWCHVSFKKGKYHGLRRNQNHKKWSFLPEMQTKSKPIRYYLNKAYQDKHRLAIQMYKTLIALVKKDDTHHI